MNIIFSIIIPIYNVTPYLKDCLDSIIQQIFKEQNQQYNIECICIDDGSTDNPDIILNEYVDKFITRGMKLKIFHQNNSGVGNARNLGLNSANGDWILFLDGDDVLHPYTIKRISEIVINHPDLDSVQFRLKRFADKDICKWDAILDSDCDIHDISKTFEGAPTCNFTCLAYRADVLKELRFSRLIIGEDLLFLSQFIERTKKIGIIYDILYGYRERLGSAIKSRFTIKQLIDKLESLKSIIILYANSSKIVPPSNWRLICNSIIETVSYEWMSLPKESREKVKIEWKKIIEIIYTSYKESFPFQQRIRIYLIHLFPIIAIPILCQFPYWLKTKGIHR